ncbi:histidine kinase [Tenacibaculum ovolyticum]|uniref:sensor histidine kinase n=1 Tax=Tenacibaculum ovolyticum TaxID=104270 RepID=UPI0022F3A4E4|nr:histidine kinase [Tenacibaculum ovolyticum]WBX78406.1 histidine kinase [Tenacibaculum ovolyticum]
MFLFLLAPVLCAQNKDNFVMFGHTPRVVNRQLYKSLYNAKEPKEKLVLLDSIATLFLRSNNADSLFYYGTTIKNELFNLKKVGKLKDKYELKGLLYKGLGSQNMGFLEESIGYFIKGITLAKKDGLVFQRFQLALADTYILKRDTLKLKNILDELKPICNTEPLLVYHKIAASNYNILTKQPAKAKTIIKAALKTINKNKFPKIYLRLKAALAMLISFEGKFDEALSIFSKIKQETLANGYYDIYISITLNQGGIYQRSKNYDVAEMVLSSAYVNSVQWNQLNLQKKIIRALVQLYVTKEDFKNAYNLKTQLESVNRKIIKNQNLRYIRNLEFKYETLKKEKKISKLQEDQVKKETEIEYQKTIKYSILIGFFIILIPIILFLIVYYQKLQTQSLLNKQQEALRQKEMTSILQAQELELIKNTIIVQNKERDRIARELHDSIGGNIAGIKLQMNNLIDSNPEVSSLLEQLEKTYQHVRDISHSLIPDEFKENNFTVLVKNYIATLNQNNTVLINFEAYPEKTVNALNYTLQSNLLNIIKELITNAFKHANAVEIDLQISILKNENSIELLYEDDGIGFDLEKTNKGIGIQNIEHRVKIFKGVFSIDSALNRGTVITISIPQQDKL